MPLRNTLHVDKLLSNISVKYRNSEFIADEVFPRVPVKKDSDEYRVYTRNFRIPDTKMADSGLANQHDFAVSTATYSLEKHALKDYVSDDQEENYDLASLKADTTEELTDKIMLRKEKQCADLFTTTSWSLNVSLAAAGAWNSNTTVSNPIPVVDTGASTVILNSGFKPNYGILPHEGFIAAKNHTSVLDRVKHTSSKMTKDMLAGLFDLPQLLVPIVSYDTSAEGGTETIAAIWGDSMFLGYKPNRPSPRTPSAGYTFMNAKPPVKTWRDEERESLGIRVKMRFQARVVASLAGYLIKDIV